MGVENVSGSANGVAWYVVLDGVADLRVSDVTERKDGNEWVFS